MFQRLLFVVLSLTIFVVSGCAGIEPPNPGEVLKHPLGKDSIRTGMIKDEVLDMWGEPDMKTYTGTSELGALQEEWVYRGRYPELPINAG